MLNNLQMINTRLDREINKTSEDTFVNAFLDYLNPSEQYGQYRPFSQLFVFGDSLSDTCNTFKRTKEALGQGLPPAPPYFSRRFSDGPVWVEYLAHFLKLSHSCHTNFAVSGATTGDANTFPLDTVRLPGLKQQLEAFIQSLNNAEADRDALYVLWAGANDYLAGGVTDPTEPIANLTNAVKVLLDVGARQIMVANLPDLGSLPGTRKLRLSKGLHALSVAHNTGLAASLKTLHQKFHSDAVEIILFDVDALTKQMWTEPSEFGFTNVTDSALARVAKFEGYGDNFFFWDNIHPTTIVHLTLAKTAVSQLIPKLAIAS
jgi:phospholipase/lecithinase/hemolysin